MHFSGEFLANTQFGFAVVVVSAGKEGDTKKELLLTEARAMVVRDYLVEKFGFDDTRLKTLGIGKQVDTSSDGDWGTVRILIYPAGTVMPGVKHLPAVSQNAEHSAPVSSAAVPR